MGRIATASQWKHQRALDEAMAFNSTQAGQNLLHGYERRVVAVNTLPATRSNPHGLGTRLVRREPAQSNPLTVLSTKGEPQYAQNLMRQASGVRINKASVAQTAKWVALRDTARVIGPLPGQD